jgi:hypothetical protein
MVTGLFRDRASAEQAIVVVTERGYAPSEVNVVIDDDVPQRYFAAHAANDSMLASANAGGPDRGGPAGGTPAHSSPRSPRSARFSSFQALSLRGRWRRRWRPPAQPP